MGGSTVIGIVSVQTNIAIIISLVSHTYFSTCIIFFFSWHRQFDR